MADLLTVISTALKTGGKPATDQVFNASPATARMLIDGAYEVADGPAITEELVKGKNRTVGWRPAKASVPMQEADPMTLVQFRDANLDGAIVIFKSDEDRCGGREKQVAKKLLENGLNTMGEAMAYAWHSAGVGPEGETMILGAPAAISATNSYGIEVDADGNFGPAMNRSLDAYSWWRAQVDATVEDIGIDSGANGGIRGMIIRCSVGLGKSEPDMVELPPELWQKLLAQMPPNVSHDPVLYKLGYANFQIGATTVVRDPWCPGPSAPAGLTADTSTVYVLTTSGWKVRPRPSCAKQIRQTDIVSLVPVGKDAKALLLRWEGQLTCVTPRNQGIMTGKS